MLRETSRKTETKDNIAANGGNGLERTSRRDNRLDADGSKNNCVMFIELSLSSADESENQTVNI